MRQDTVIRHGEEGFAGMRKAGALAAAVLDMITPHVVVGVDGKVTHADSKQVGGHGFRLFPAP